MHKTDPWHGSVAPQSVIFEGGIFRFSNLFLSVILPQIKELEDIRMPRLKVDCESARPLVSSLINIPRGVVVNPQHRHNTIGITVRPGNVRTSSTDVVDIQPNTTSSLRNHSTDFKSVINSFYGIVLHSYQEAR